MPCVRDRERSLRRRAHCPRLYRVLLLLLLGARSPPAVLRMHACMYDFSSPSVLCLLARARCVSQVGRVHLSGVGKQPGRQVVSKANAMLYYLARIFAVHGR